MALNFSTKDVADDSHLLSEDGKYWNEVCKSISFNTMNVGINKITKENAEKFYQRYLAWNFVQSGSFEAFLTFEEVEKSIGFSTNASNLTDTQFNKTLANTVMMRAQAKINNAKHDKAHPAG